MEVLACQVIEAVEYAVDATQRQALQARPRFLSGADVMVSPWKPYSRALMLGLCQATDMLVSTTEDLTQKDLDEALQEIVGLTHLDARPETKRLVEVLVDHGADVNGEAEPFGDALHAAARTGEGTGKISS